MDFKLVILWTDVALWALLVVLIVYGLRIRSQASLRDARNAPWTSWDHDAASL